MFEWQNRGHLNNNLSLILKGQNVYRDTPERHSWLSVFKICKMMCPNAPEGTSCCHHHLKGKNDGKTQTGK
jgi:hypothetical protein